MAWSSSTACKAGGINPIIGIEAYLTGDMRDHSKRYSDDYHHLLLLAKNNTGYYNLLKLTTIAIPRATTCARVSTRKSCNNTRKD